MTCILITSSNVSCTLDLSQYIINWLDLVQLTKMFKLKDYLSLIYLLLPNQLTRPATTVNNDHRFQFDASTVNLNAMLCTEGFANRVPTRFLLDSGAAISVVQLRSLSEEEQTITKTESSAAVSANGTPLDIGGQVKLVVSIGSFTYEHTFIVIRDLTVDCLLGADSLGCDRL